MTRKALSAAVKLEAIGIWCSVNCPGCNYGVALSEMQYDHIVPYAFGRDDSATNIKPLCKLCHAKKTFGTKSTTASGDLHKIAKAKRLAKAKETHAAIVAKVEAKKPGKIKSRKFPAVSVNFPKQWGVVK